MQGSILKDIFRNFSYLYAVRIVAMVTPFLVIPHLTKTLGAEIFGQVFFVQSFALYLMIFMDFGFELFAPGKIASMQKSEEVSDFVSRVQIIKLIIASISSLVLLTFGTFYSEEIPFSLYLVWFLAYFFQAQIPFWLFQGLSDFKGISYIQSISRVLFSVLVLVLIKDESDYLMFPFLECGNFLLITLLGWGLYFKKGYRFQKVTVSGLLETFKESSHFFLSKSAISLYTTSTTFLLGLFHGNSAVAAYAGPMKLIEAINNLMSPVNQVMYPLLTRVSKNVERVKKYAMSTLGVTFIVSLGISIILFFFHSWIVNNVFGKDFGDSIQVFKYISFIPFFVMMSNTLGLQIMLGLGWGKAFNKVLIIGSLIGFSIIAFLVKNYSFLGAAQGVLISEALIMIFMGTVLFKKFNLYTSQEP